jgi:tRNA threonylcarbamoyladenosine biosynthesis protein TsaB
MRVLALDTTTPAGSAALVEDDRILAEERGDGTRPHAERLPSELLRILARVGLPLSAVDLFAVAAGPGSFTGLRIGIATVQGLAFVQQKRIVAVSALEAAAHAVSGDLRPGDLVGAWIDAHRRDVFSALFRVGLPAIFAGDGAVTYHDSIGGGGRVVEPACLAGAIGRLAVMRARAGEAIDAAAVQPLYVRRPDAEIARDARQQQSSNSSR